LNGVQVLVSDSPVPIYYVLTDKIAFLMPMNAPTSGTVEVQVVKQSTGQVLALRHLEMAPASPALFTLNGQGFGQIAAYNDDGTLNGPNPPRLLQFHAVSSFRCMARAKDSLPAPARWRTGAGRHRDRCEATSHH
jgi:hypothetical protein